MSRGETGMLLRFGWVLKGSGVTRLQVCASRAMTLAQVAVSLARLKCLVKNRFVCLRGANRRPLIVRQPNRLAVPPK